MAYKSNSFHSAIHLLICFSMNIYNSNFVIQSCHIIDAASLPHFVQNKLNISGNEQNTDVADDGKCSRRTFLVSKCQTSKTNQITERMTKCASGRISFAACFNSIVFCVPLERIKCALNEWKISWICSQITKSPDHQINRDFIFGAPNRYWITNYGRGKQMYSMWYLVPHLVVEYHF